MWRDDAYLLDMFLAAQKVQSFTKDVTWERFQDDEILQNAVLIPLLQPLVPPDKPDSNPV